MNDVPEGQQEYRVTELARAAGVKVRNLRYYQERGLLPRPRREGRVTWYSQEHLARLRLISGLLDRGYAVNGIAELLAAWEQGSGVAELLGLERAMTREWSREEPVKLTVDELAAMFGHEATEPNLRRAVALGYLTLDGDTVTHLSRRLLDGTLALVKEGVPLSVVLDAGEFAQSRATELADRFVEVIRTHVIGAGGADHRSPAELRRIAEAVEALRPVAGDVVDAEFARAMERRVRAELGQILRHEEGSGSGAQGSASQ
ncbi:MerR family transcriptional regulator [Streptomyces sp. NPDC101393]|uniref:MerR family transcriptional regulator n=1 Tax=Streptomyces sp. NPDC101393 TaxID=3366141 RepID=UPI00381624F7